MNKPVFHSQHGEDILLYHALAGSKGPDFYVEVGMIDGLRFSNSLAFEKIGWKGICVEAHPGYIDLVRANRPNSTVIHAAVGASPEESATFYAEPMGAISGLAPRDEQALRDKFDHFDSFSKVSVQVVPLSEVLEQQQAPREFDFLSVDVEGTELDVLRGTHLDQWRPRVILVEAHSQETAAELDQYLAQYGYGVARTLSVNRFYASDPIIRKRLRRSRINKPLHIYPHPKNPRESPRVVPPPASPHWAARIGRRVRRAIRPAK